MSNLFKRRFYDMYYTYNSFTFNDDSNYATLRDMSPIITFKQQKSLCKFIQRLLSKPILSNKEQLYLYWDQKFFNPRFIQAYRLVRARAKTRALDPGF